MHKALVGIDIGSSSLKVCAFDTAGNLLHHAHEKTPTHQSPDSSWFDAVELRDIALRLLQQTTNAIAAQGWQVQALAATGMGESFVALDANGEPIAPILAWFDQGPLRQIPVINAAVQDQQGKDQLFHQTGMEPNPIFTLPKLLHLRERSPKIYDRIATILSVPGYITYCLCGVKCMDYSLASRTMLFDVATNTWSDAVLQLFALEPHLFPNLVPSGTPLGTIKPEIAQRTGLGNEVLVTAGGHDHFCGSFAAGLLKGHRIVDSSGTAESIHGLTSTAGNPFQSFAGFRVGRYVDPAYLYLVGGIVSSGIAVEHAVRMFVPQAGYAFIDEQLAKRKLEQADIARLPLFLPHLRGSGSPQWDRTSRGVFAGLTDNTMPEEMVISVMEGLSMEFRTIITNLTLHLSEGVTQIVATGGGAKNLFWQQMKADITGLSIEVTDIVETTALGVAMLAGVGSGVYHDLREATERVSHPQLRIEPHAGLKSVYDDRYQVYQQLYPATIDINRRLVDIARTYQGAP
jgi:xylulokinase